LTAPDSPSRKMRLPNGALQTLVKVKV
jgi:hypothetical protein